VKLLFKFSVILGNVISVNILFV